MRNSPGNFFRRRGWWILLGQVVLLGTGSILWVKLLPRYVASTIQHKTGFVVQVAEFSANPFTGRVVIRDLVLINPEAWDGENFIELHEFRAQASCLDLLAGRYRADEIVIDVTRVNLVRNKEGVLNARAFKERLTGKAAGPGNKPKEFLIKKLVLKFDKLTINNHSDLLPGTRTYHLNVDTELHDVDSMAKLLSPFQGQARHLIDDTILNVFSGSADLLKDAAGLIWEGGKKTGESLKGLLDSLDKKKP